MLESLSTEELQFVKAIEQYKKEKSKLFLSWTEVLKIFKDLGYKKVASAKKATEPKPKKEKAPAASTSAASTSETTTTENATAKAQPSEVTT